jgi:hypothetical protein
LVFFVQTALGNRLLELGEGCRVLTRLWRRACSITSEKLLLLAEIETEILEVGIVARKQDIERHILLSELPRKLLQSCAKVVSIRQRLSNTTPAPQRADSIPISVRNSAIETVGSVLVAAAGDAVAANDAKMASKLAGSCLD